MGLCGAEMLSKVTQEGVNSEAFDRSRVAVKLVELATPLSVPEIQPVGCLITGAGETRLLNESLQQYWAIGIAGLPVLRQAPTDQGKNTRSEVTAADPGQNQEPGVVDNQVELARAL